MKRGVILQERDIELLKFLAEYKTITLDNARYIYGTKTYQEKRICRLVKDGYVVRLKHREITLGKNGRIFLDELGVKIKEHCRNSNNLERLKVISDIAAFTRFNNYNCFIASWNLKSRDNHTTDSRRYLGILTFDRDVYNIYAVYGNKNDKYITSIYYDLKKEKEIPYSIIFTNDIDKILYDKRRILF